LTALGTLALTNERTPERKISNIDSPSALIKQILQLSGLQDGAFAQAEDIIVVTEVIKEEDVIEYLDTQNFNLYIRIKGGRSGKEMFDDIKKRYGLIIHQTGNGKVLIMDPFILGTNPRTRDSEDNPVAWDFAIDNNIWGLDYGDITQDINSVVVIGRPPNYGMAVDVGAIELSSQGRDINKTDYRWRVLENRDLLSDEDCQKVARNKLLEFSKNFVVNFKTVYDPRFEVGQLILISDDKKLDKRPFIIKSFSLELGKDSCVCSITAYANSVQQFPEELVIAPDGINDVDALQITKQVQDVFQWSTDL
jgi:hypothetical protein